MTPRILVVEDEEPLCALIDYNLVKEGFAVRVSTDGDEALRAVEEERFDLVVLDWMLPRVSGIEICRRLRGRRSTRNLPIIMLTARDGEEDRLHGLKGGVDEYLTKPFSMGELIARTRALLRESGLS